MANRYEQNDRRKRPVNHAEISPAEMTRRRIIARRRRELERKRRIRRAVILCVLLGLVTLAMIIFLISNSSNNDQQGGVDTVTASVVPSSASPALPSSSPQTSAGAGVQTSIPPASEQNDLLKIATAVESEQKICYLTFDDGPTTSITPQILDILRRYNVKATFFQLGSLIKANGDMARRVYEEGHLIANHSYAHEYRELYASEEAFMSEIDQTYELIKQVTGDDNYFKLVRFPGGSYNAGSYGEAKQRYKPALADAGYYFVDWNALNGDAEGGKKNASQLLEGLKSSAGSKNNIVVLMHDAPGKQTTVDALPSIIEWCMEQGYEFRRLDEV